MPSTPTGHRIRVAGDTFHVPRKVYSSGPGPNVATWLADEMVSRQMIPWDPTDLTVEEITERVAEDGLTDAEIDRMLAVESRTTARAAIRKGRPTEEDE